jgi:hypothetical protein
VRIFVLDLSNLLNIILTDSGPYIGFFYLGVEGEARVVKASTPENFEKLDALRGVFPPSQKLKDIPTKCTFCVNFVGKTIRSD